MKHWFFYITLPKDDLESIPLLKILVKPIDSGIHMRPTSTRRYTNIPDLKLSEDGEFLYGLYAWCSNSDLAKLFKASRNSKYFTCKKIDISTQSTEWEHLHSLFKSYEIIRTGYSDDNGKTYSVPMTYFESDIICDNTTAIIETLTDTLVAERNLKRKSDDEFRIVLDIFQNDLLYSLEKFCWSMFIVEYGFLDCDICKLGRSENDPDYLIDEYYQNASYNTGLFGVNTPDFTLNLITVYIFMLGEMLE